MEPSYSRLLQLLIVQVLKYKIIFLYLNVSTHLGNFIWSSSSTALVLPFLHAFTWASGEMYKGLLFSLSKEKALFRHEM
jgi:hypothetical protein